MKQPELNSDGYQCDISGLLLSGVLLTDLIIISKCPVEWWVDCFVGILRIPSRKDIVLNRHSERGEESI